MTTLDQDLKIASAANALRLIANEATRRVWELKDKGQLKLIKEYAEACIKELEK